ncbi:MAG: hypothetical protein EPN60_00320 [Nevskiaceae bacterium]|nr:MAG: hypothetical protein EPO48_03285 [Nevskiaceae bacterium]TAM33926.1 MAG: hypothetical protein EPN60_00320 [Nevskiaceae bacterium]
MNLLRQYGVALVSLVVSLGSLGYATWRNETSEQQRNTRYAAFRGLEELGQLQVLVDRHQYGAGESDYVTGWARVLLIHDLASLLPEPAHGAAERLQVRWKADFEAWDDGSDKAAGERISAEIGAARKDMLATLMGLR